MSNRRVERKSEIPGRLDIPSAALSLAAILPTIYVIKRVAEHAMQMADGAVLIAAVGFGLLTWVVGRPLGARVNFAQSDDHP
jgi:hypothetical protein